MFLSVAKEQFQSLTEKSIHPYLFVHLDLGGAKTISLKRQDFLIQRREWLMVL